MLARSEALLWLSELELSDELDELEELEELDELDELEELDELSETSSSLLHPASDRAITAAKKIVAIFFMIFPPKK